MVTGCEVKRRSLLLDVGDAAFGGNSEVFEGYLTMFWRLMSTAGHPTRMCPLWWDVSRLTTPRMVFRKHAAGLRRACPSWARLS